MGEQEDRADALGDMVNGHPELVPVVLAELAAILREPDDHYALEAAIVALGHAWDFRASALLLKLVDVDHPESNVRLALARALPGGSDNEPCRNSAITALVRLTADAVDEVRDWACFGLGQLGADRDDVREALAARLNDAHIDTRYEALVALSKTGDGRALAACQSALANNPDDIFTLALEAASELADPRLLPALQRLQTAWETSDDDHSTKLNIALRRCQPGLDHRATEAEKHLAETVIDLAVERDER
jgi:HEAT repeat protein